MFFSPVTLVQLGLVESKEDKEKREKNNQVIKSLPPIRESAGIAICTILNNNSKNTNTNESNNSDNKPKKKLEIN
jgi:hypothetical protein